MGGEAGEVWRNGDWLTCHVLGIYEDRAGRVEEGMTTPDILGSTKDYGQVTLDKAFGIFIKTR